MSKQTRRQLDRQLERMERRLPGPIARFVRWVREPSSRWVRLPLAIALILGGIVGFLPILGFWMIPLGLIVLAKDVPPLQGPLARMLAWIEAKWDSHKQARSASD